MIELDKKASEAMSESAGQEIKESIIIIDDQLSTLSKEIDTYNNTPERQRYFYQIYKQYIQKCE
jgi:hypothetical protein